ncbi:DHHW family protein [Clostridium sp. Marseille-P299]|uniref:DHHW family protein n=1 Tax=Clostridium sp. Marseille-P299 TaxID=1805477 RepID=UPI0008363340|nr:DHHW family protein [Clostridium sp. Marseille-P299]
MLQKLKTNLNRYTITSILFLIIIFFYLIGMIINSDSVKSSIKTSIEKVESESSADILKAFVNGTDSAFNNAVFDKITLLNANGLFNRILQKKMVTDVVEHNNVYKLDNGQLTYLYDNWGMSLAHKNMRKLNEYLSSVGTKLLYVQAPYKVDKYDNQLPHGRVDYPNLNTDKFLAGLDKLGIDYIDFREVIHDSNFTYEDLFFNTDHHWTTQTGFWAYTYLMNYMGENYGVKYDERNVKEENFNFVTLKDSFVGSLANRVGYWYAGIDDFTYIYPKFDTSYTWERYFKYGSLDITRTGAFEDTVLFKERVVETKEPQAYRDNCYFNGNPALARITNNDVKDGRVLVIQDSFGKPVSSFLSLNFHQVDVLDLRDYRKMYLLDYVKENQYDYVIFIYNPSVFKRSTYYVSFRFEDPNQ